LAQRLKQVFGIDIETCRGCGGAIRIIAGIEDPVVIDKILTHLDSKAAEPQAIRRPPYRAPPERGCSTRGGRPDDVPPWAVPSAARPRRRLTGWEGEREERAGEPVVGTDSDAVTPLRGDW